MITRRMFAWAAGTALGSFLASCRQGETLLEKAHRLDEGWKDHLATTTVTVPSGFTICANCKHFIRKGDIWYDQFCGASPSKQRVDPVTGRMAYILGQPYAYARDINLNGNCPLYEEKGSP